MVHDHIKIGKKTIPNLNLKQDLESHTKKPLRNGPRKVALKQHHNSQNMCPQFLNELESSFYCNSDKIVHIYGITQDPKTKDYMIVMHLVEQGNLRSYIRENSNKLTWIKKIKILLDIAQGIHSIHQAGLCHKNIHTGNLLYDNDVVLISDLGVSGPADKLCDYNEAIGVIQYMAPEILRGKPYTKSADIYAFAIVMSEIASERPPFVDIPRDNFMNLVYDLCDGYRPLIKNYLPKCFETLMIQCWDDDEFNRPHARQLVDKLFEWYNEIRNNTNSEICLQFKTADEHRQLRLKLPLYKYDIYKSRRIRTTDLGDDINFSGDGYHGYGNDFPALLVRESGDGLEDEEDLREYEHVSMQRNDFLSWLENVEDEMPNLLDYKF
ncbi:1998_t:CDS:2 [Cetraspora pellucida]|uniref:1998_t:CDS:1 n=1 Tax=Cetraspora pellucida TaxID=1433469 RepID=A0A9N9N5F4_9GLOM|nr:1998_t:CDS:2 [Cetraspora pellucida]